MELAFAAASFEELGGAQRGEDGTVLIDVDDGILREPSAADPATEEARVKRLQKLLETADGDERVLLEEELREAERNLEQQKRGQWKISPEEIGMYREKQAAFRVLDSYFLRDLVGTGGDQEAMEAFRMLFYGDENGEINPEKALEMIDKKLRMKRMEGN